MHMFAKHAFLALSAVAFAGTALANPPPTAPASTSAPAAGAAGSTAVTTGSVDVDPPFDQRMKDCMAIWDKGTHMTKAQWRRSCRTTLRSLESE